MKIKSQRKMEHPNKKEIKAEFRKWAKFRIQGIWKDSIEKLIIQFIEEILVKKLTIPVYSCQKELGYRLCDVLWYNLDGYRELWDRSEFYTKEKIINELGELAIKLTIPKFEDWVKTMFTKNEDLYKMFNISLQ